ncbi:MAG: hypothetical protein M1838_000585 [Thelocarpon superellum]|nr:MAG: hypothetical protein M1838_000585 [Thelocarpon superellum]
MDEDGDGLAMLTQLSEKVVQQPVRPGLMTYCPTMDLLAVATDEERVYVYRLNGQRVLGLGNKGQTVAIRRLRWKPNGQLLAAGWSDNIVRLINADSGKVVQQVETSVGASRTLTCLGWGVNFTRGKNTAGRVDGSRRALDQILGRESPDDEARFVPDLPRELALVDVESCLPKLSLLPAGGRDEDVFSSRASLDSMFHPLSKDESNAVDVLVACFDDSSIHLSIFGTFDVGTLDLGKSSGLRVAIPVLHDSYADSSTHALLVAAPLPTTAESRLLFLPLDLRFIATSGPYLPVLAAKSTQLQNILRYVGQVVKTMQAEWKSGQDLPTKFLRNITEALQEECQCDFNVAAYHLVVTGYCFAPLKRWLVDELSERGHKRWDKAVTACYENLRRLTHENLIPALERCGVILSRLRGLSRFQASQEALGLSTQDLDRVFDLLDCLALLAHTILKHTSVELGQFTAFSAWLRHEIDTQAAESSSSADDPAEKDPVLEHAVILDYIQGGMAKSKLCAIFPPTALDELDEHHLDQTFDERGRFPSADFKENLKHFSADLPAKSNSLDLALLSRALDRLCGVAFRQIAEAQKRNVLFGTPVPLGPGGAEDALDLKMLSEGGISTSYMMVRGGDASREVSFFRVRLKVQNGVSSTHDVEQAAMALGSGEVRDAKFVDDEMVMILWTSQVCHNFSPDAFQPIRLEVNGRKGRRVVCVLGNDGLHYKIFDLDSGSPEIGPGRSLIEDDQTMSR